MIGRCVIFLTLLGFHSNSNDASPGPYLLVGFPQNVGGTCTAQLVYIACYDTLSIVTVFEAGFYRDPWLAGLVSATMEVMGTN